MICPLDKKCDKCEWFISMYLKGTGQYTGQEVMEKKCVMAWMPILTAEIIKTNVELIKQCKSSPIATVGYGSK